MNQQKENITFSFNEIELGLTFGCSTIGTLFIFFYLAASITLLAMGEYSTTDHIPNDIRYSSLILSLPLGLYITNRIWESAFKRNP